MVNTMGQQAGNWVALGIGALLLALALVAAGCDGAATTYPDTGEAEASEPVALGAEDNGRQVRLAPGQVLVVSLASNPTTGYSWEVIEADAAVLQQQGEAEFQQSETGDQQMVGVGGTETLRFAAAEPGQTTLTLVYHRPWEKDVEPLETFSVEVVVR